MIVLIAPIAIEILFRLFVKAEKIATESGYFDKTSPKVVLLKI